MKRNCFSKFLAVAAGVLALGSAGMQAAEEPVVLRFNESSTAANWSRWWGINGTAITWDGALDVAGATNSGSLKVVVPFASTNSDNQFAIRGALAGNGQINGGTAKIIDATKYARVEFDLYWDVNSPMRMSGDHGYLEVGMVPTDFTQVWLPGFGVPMMDGWQHITLNLASITNAADVAKLANISGLVFKMWAGGGDALTGNATFHVDNIKITPKGFITGFDDGGFVSSNAFWNWWGGATRAVEWDATKDAKGDTNSGALKFTATFSGTGDNQYSQGMSLAGSGSYNGSLVVTSASTMTLEFDYLWDTNSTFDVNVFNGQGDPQGLGIGTGAATGWAFSQFANAVQPRFTNDGGWQHASIPIPATLANIGGLVFKKYFPAGPAGTATFWVDNIQFIPSGKPVPPPTLHLETVKGGGLNLVTTGTGQYDRHGIRTMASNYDWLSRTNTMTYSFDLVSMPDPTAYAGFQTHLFLVPGTTLPSDPDWSAPTLIFLDIKAAAGGMANATFRWKTNQPGANNADANGHGLFVGGLSNLTSRLAGTWSITVSNQTNFIVRGPDGASMTVPLSQETVDQFWTTPNELANLTAYIGVQPNNPANIGQRSVVSKFSIQEGSSVLLEDTFSLGELDTLQWGVAGPASGVQFINDASWIVSWTMPDAGFTGWQWSTNLINGPWHDVDTFTGTATTVGGGIRNFRIPLTELPALPAGANQFYLRLVNPTGVFVP